jgi:8-oxo-dGTP pyrophosphatase MutT (NUDIX family)
MTTLGALVKGHDPTVVPLSLDLDALAKEVNVLAVTASLAQPLGTLASITAALSAWTYQDDDAHEPCSLTACRAPLHPGPCKGWKGTLHAVSPHIWKQVEQERVDKANARRAKKIADLKAQGKPIPRRLLTEIKPKPAPGPGASGSHPANNATPTPLGKVNQQADLTGGQAHAASQAINKAAGVTPNTANLPKGPKGKKPTVAGRGPAFVITQSKVTDTYKLDKASKITPQEWDSLTPGDQKLIRDELEAIKKRGFGPQQTKADQLLAKLSAKPTIGNTSKPNAPATPGPQPPPAAPGKKTLGQAVKNAPGPAPAATAPSTALQGRAAAEASAKSALAITEALHGPQKIDVAKLATAIDMMKAKGDLKSQPNFRLLVDRLAQDALKQASADKMPGLGHGANDDNITTINHAIRDHIADGKPGLPDVIDRIKKHHDAVKAGKATPSAPSAPSNTPSAPKNGVPGTPSSPPKAAPASPPSTPAAPKAPAGPTQQAPGAPSGIPKAFPPHVQRARAVAGRAVGRPTSKAHVDAYGKLSKSDFDQLDATTQKTIRDDLANASAKFLDPKKKQQARDLLDRFGAKHPTPAKGADSGPAKPSAPTPNVAPSQAPAPHPKGYSDPQDQAVKNATDGTASTDDVLKSVARLTPDQVSKLDDADRRAVLGRLAFIATHPKATDVQKERATAYGRIVNKGPLATPPNVPGQTPTLGELHRHEEATGAAKVKAALDAADVNKATGPHTPEDRAKALSTLTRKQFDALPDDEKRAILDALQHLHYTGGSANLKAQVSEAIREYTGDHPAVHRIKQAEADFRAGAITGKDVYAQFARARTQVGFGTPDEAQLNKESARIARDNPTLPTHVLVHLAGEPKYGNSAYDAIHMAGMSHMWDPAPRLSPSDMGDLFRPTADNLKSVDPIHAQAVRDLQVHALRSGLRGQPGVPGGSPWGISTRDAVVKHLLDPASTGEIPSDRLADFRALPADVQNAVRTTVAERLKTARTGRAKVEAWVTLRELEGEPPLQGTVRDAVLAAGSFVSSHNVKMDAYRKLSPADFRALPDFVRATIGANLNDAQIDAARLGAVVPWSQGDSALKKLPAALSAHLAGTRATYADRAQREAADIATYGTGIIRPQDRVAAYNRMTAMQFQSLQDGAPAAIDADLDKIENDGTLPLQTRYDAAMNRHVFLKKNSQITLTPQQLSAVQAADDHPSSRYSDAAALGALHGLSKADYDSLSPTFREAIDARLSAMPGPAQQVLTARFHPGAPAAATPAGVTPTTGQTNVPAHVQTALDVLYGVDPKSHTMAKQLSAYGDLRGSDFNAFNVQEQQQLLADLSFIATTAKGPSGDKAKKLIDRFTPAGTPSGQLPPNPAIIPPANSVPGQVRYANPIKGLSKAANSGRSGDGWLTLPGGKRVWGHYGAAGLLIKHTDPNSGEERYLMVQRGPAISDPGKWTFPGGASDSLETPHQGATRETIEELGLKDDQFKDALVHGDHTFTVPGSTWKYTTVAASVPTMFKPNLSTAHARAETSDAKWMTLAEIRALDSSGKLHGPIAGGLLEKNVISLYPQGAAGGGKLGQIARPGPVTKRPNRLVMPAGGRQAPASYNAWPHPHKKSTGKNLVPDKAAIDAMRQQVKKDRVLYDGKTADGRLAAIGAMQGYDDTPTVVSKSEIDKLLATGDYIEAWRGVSGSGGGWSARSRGGSGGKTAEQINEEMRSGPAYYGKGIFGNGYYLATNKRVAEQYSDHSKGSLVRILIPKRAVTEQYDKVEREAQSNSTRSSKAKGASSFEVSTFWDPGRWAAAKGLDGIEINQHHRSAGGGASHVASTGKPAFNWLNRSVLIIQKEPG